MAQLTLPDGRRITIPDGLKPEQIKKISDAAMSGAAPQQGPSLSREELLAKRDALDAQLENTTFGGMVSGIGSDIDDNVRLAANGISMGFLDKALGEDDRQRTNDARERQGFTGMGSEVLGSMLPATGLAKGVSAVGSVLPATLSRFAPSAMEGIKGLAARSLLMGGEGAALGAGQAVGNDADPTTGALVGLGSGVAGNVLGEGISGLVSKTAGLFNKAPKVMAPKEIKDAASAAFQRADDAGVIFKPEAIGKLRDAVQKDMADFGFHPRNQPGADIAYDELSRLAEGGNVSWTGLNTARKVAKGGFQAGNKSNNKLLNAIISKMDEFSANASPDDLLTGNAGAASAAQREANDLWSRQAKLETVNKLLKRGQLNAETAGSGGNVQNAMTQQLKRILTNENLGRGFKPDELKAIEKAITDSTTRKVLRTVGKLSPQGNGLMAALGLLGMGGGAVAGGPIGAGAVAAGMGAGYTSKKLSEAMTKRAAENLKKLIAAGGNKAALEVPKNAVQRLSDSGRDALIKALMMSGITAAHGNP